jgi:hypothetical protein
LDPMPARLKLVQACDQWHSSRVSTPLPVDTVNCVQTLKDTLTKRQGSYFYRRFAPLEIGSLTPEALMEKTYRLLIEDARCSVSYRICSGRLLGIMALLGSKPGHLCDVISVVAESMVDVKGRPFM